MAKIDQQLPRPPYSPDFDPSEFYLLPDLNKILKGKKSGWMKRWFVRTQTYCEAKDEASYKKRIETSEKDCSDYIALEDNFDDE